MPQHIGPSVQRLLDRLADTPIAVFDAAWTLLEHNDLWTALHGDMRGRGGRSANPVWRSFHDAPGRVRHLFPDDHKKSLVADLRDVATRYPADRELADMTANCTHRAPNSPACGITPPSRTTGTNVRPSTIPKSANSNSTATCYRYTAQTRASSSSQRHPAAKQPTSHDC
ncbi:hypothetical protein GCM10009753_44730 [Streptantibioticus ferralitis]|uniref:MmyB-like transcription regulator ligand binding domain-containing protein n=1 Tax=Streptantibioticus ferralitis TaxID=236510 RepID=A0ABT5Z4U5_9ACTN|nr:hypothetical protein [Streptantibioticus ferralitis]MDF2258846.1 hypothetical protein [Streptantibioticus ferralitis]